MFRFVSSITYSTWVRAVEEDITCSTKLTTLAPCGWCLWDQTGGRTESAKRFREKFICNESLPSHT